MRIKLTLTPEDEQRLKEMLDNKEDIIREGIKRAVARKREELYKTLILPGLAEACAAYHALDWMDNMEGGDDE